MVAGPRDALPKVKISCCWSANLISAEREKKGKKREKREKRKEKEEREKEGKE